MAAIRLDSGEARRGLGLFIGLASRPNNSRLAACIAWAKAGINLLGEICERRRSNLLRKSWRLNEPAACVGERAVAEEREHRRAVTYVQNRPTCEA